MIRNLLHKYKDICGQRFTKGGYILCQSIRDCMRKSMLWLGIPIQGVTTYAESMWLFWMICDLAEDFAWQRMMSDSSSEHQHMYPRIRLLLVCKVYITWCCATDINLADMPVLLTHVHLSCNRLVLLLHLLLNKLCISLSLPHVLNDISISTSTWNIKSSTDWAQQVTFTTVLEESTGLCFTRFLSLSFLSGFFLLPLFAHAQHTYTHIHTYWRPTMSSGEASDGSFLKRQRVSRAW